jgi:membrane associated rhomboid family serine protease
MSGAEERTVVALARRQREADERVLVLQSEGLDALARRGPEGWRVETPAAEAERGRALLAAWERENRPVPAPPLPPLRPFPWNAAALLALALLGFFAETGPREGGSDWFARGAAEAARIRGGEWWRATTALTLHADAGHLLGNLLAGTLFGGTLAQRFGGGIALALLVAAGTFGNLANAWLHARAHSSVGASTAVFAAVGALAADALVQKRVPRGGRLAPLGAGLGILAMLGTSERADVWAHVFGLAAGAALGLPLARAVAEAPPPAWQTLSGALAIAAVCGAWWLAR